MIFIYPDRKESLLELYRCCENVNLPKPICWDESRLQAQIKQLITLTHSGNSLDDSIDCCSRITKPAITEPVILFSDVSQKLIKRVIAIYKSNSKWPIFAVITPLSLEMTLSCLLGHLLDDRKKELAYKKQQSSLNNSSG